MAMAQTVDDFARDGFVILRAFAARDDAALDFVDLGDERPLVVDDVADTGETLKLVADTLRVDFPWSTLPPVEGRGSTVS